MKNHLVASSSAATAVAEEETTGFHYPAGHHRIDTAEFITNRSATTNKNKFTPLEVFQDEHPYQQEELGDDNHQHHNHHHIGSARTPWYGTTIILLSEVMGTGVLSLPYAARTLGWAWTVIAVPLFAIVAAYSGWLLSYTKIKHSSNNNNINNNINNKPLGSYADATTELLGHKFGTFTKLCMLVNWGCTAIYYLIALSDGIGDLFYDGTLIHCDYQKSLIAIGILVIPCQCVSKSLFFIYYIGYNI